MVVLFLSSHVASAGVLVWQCASAYSSDKNTLHQNCLKSYIEDKANYSFLIRLLKNYAHTQLNICIK